MLSPFLTYLFLTPKITCVRYTISAVHRHKQREASQKLASLHSEFTKLNHMIITYCAETTRQHILSRSPASQTDHKLNRIMECLKEKNNTAIASRKTSGTPAR